MRFLDRSSLLLVASAVSLSLVACGGGEDDDDGGQPMETEGTHYAMVVNTMTLPTDSGNLKLDIDGDGDVENALGKVLSALASQAKGLDLQGSLNKGISRGEILLLADFQTKDFTKAANAGLRVYLGDKPQPAPCASADDMVCGLHLKGTGSFSVKDGSPRDALVSGNVVGGRFTGGPGDLTIQIALDGTAINLHLVKARAQLSGISADGIMTGIVGGAITKTELDTSVLPAVATTVSGIAKKDCTGDVTKECGCSGTTGKLLLSLFDTDKNCDVSLDEIKTSGVIGTLLGADLDLDGNKQNDALSVAVGVTAVKGTWTP